MAKFEEKSIPAVFQNRAQGYGERAIVAYKDSSKAWVDISWKKMNEMVRNLGYFLLGRGIQPGDKVALFSPNRYEWWVADLAILSVAVSGGRVTGCRSSELITVL